MPENIPLVGYRPTPESYEFIRRAIESGDYSSPAHVITDAIVRVHGPAVVPPPKKGPRRPQNDQE